MEIIKPEDLYGFTPEDFKEWLKANRKHFQEGDYASDEVASMAHLVGFSWEVITPGLTHFKDAMAGTNINNRVAMFMECETWTIDQVHGAYSLDDQWRCLGKKLLYDQDFDEAA